MKAHGLHREEAEMPGDLPCSAKQMKAPRPALINSGPSHGCRPFARPERATGYWLPSPKSSSAVRLTPAKKEALDRLTDGVQAVLQERLLSLNLRFEERISPSGG